jgi:hypothetical protein
MQDLIDKTVFLLWIDSEYLRYSKKKSGSVIGMVESFCRNLTSSVKFERNFSASDLSLHFVEIEIRFPLALEK